MFINIFGYKTILTIFLKVFVGKAFEPGSSNLFTFLKPEAECFKMEFFHLELIC